MRDGLSLLAAAVTFGEERPKIIIFFGNNLGHELWGALLIATFRVESAVEINAKVPCQLMSTIRHLHIIRNAL